MTHISKTCILFLIIFFPFIIKSQQTNHDYGFNRIFNISVYDTTNNKLNRAWEGGLNSVQFCKIDLNFDGIDDFILFDRVGDRILPYLNSGQLGLESLTYAPQYERKFPELHDWVIFKDYNNDGKADIFTYSFGGIAIYKNTSTLASGLSFELMTNMLLSYQYNGFVNLFVTTADYPIIEDIDGDGDLDILSFFGLGTFLEHHKNFSMEKYGIPDSLDFKRVEQCWGNFAEGEDNNSITLNLPCPWECAYDTLYNKNSKHTGSTMQLIDLNDSGVYDLLLGDVDYSNIIALYNGGNKDSANIIAIDTAFPCYDKPIDLFTFPLAVYVDIDNDNIKDLVVSPFDPNPFITEGKNSIWFYKNIGSNTAPVFQFVTDALLQQEMIETGTGAYPVLIDIDSDSLIDLIVANYGYVDSAYWDDWGFIRAKFVSQISFFKNTGSKDNPEFTLITDDFAELSSLKGAALYPAFADLDDDGDIDMIIGNNDGLLKFYRNNAGVGNTVDMNFENLPSLDTINVGKFSTPQLIDLDNDGLIDLVLGEKGGNINFLKNIGTAQEPVFQKITDSLGKVNVTDYNLSYSGYSTPCFFRDTTGSLKLFCGSEKGHIFYYDNIDNNLNGKFNLKEPMLYYLDEGTRIGVAVADLNNDGYIDMIVGNFAGGLSYFEGKTSTFNDIAKYDNSNFNFKIYPNPASNILNIEFADNVNVGNLSTEIFNNLGVSVLKINEFNNNKFNCNISNLSEGMYFCRIIDNKNHTFNALKFIIKR